MIEDGKKVEYSYHAETIGMVEREKPSKGIDRKREGFFFA